MARSFQVFWHVLMMVLMSGLFACDTADSPPNLISSNPKANVGLVEALMMAEGKFEWRNDLGRHVFNEMGKFETIIAARNPDIAVHTLVECIDDLRSSRATLDGKRVVVGVVCYQALTQTVAHEETDSTGDIAQTWAGHISPAATPSELAAAKKVWLHVLKDKTYGFL